MDLSNTFTMKTYGWQELAVLYSPNVTAVAASRRLKNWIEEHPVLKKELEALGWKSSKRLLTPLQVEIIIRHLGEP